MKTNPSAANSLKQLVRTKYAAIAHQPRQQNASSCCGATGCGDDPIYNIMAEDYTTQQGYDPAADLGLGCGIPTQFVQLMAGQTVLDLGSGAGNDAFVARRLVGAEGKVIGVDFTPEMVTKARINADKLGYNNVEFREGDIEALPIAANRVDVVLSNCVLNLVPDKTQAFAEIARVLKLGGQFCISDIVLAGPALPAAMREAAELYAGCVTGAIPKVHYLALIAQAGFVDVTVVKEREIIIPPAILANYLTANQLADFNALGPVILSVTVRGTKLACTVDDNCC